MAEANINNFNKIARFYDMLAGLVFGSSIKKSQLHFFDQIPPNAKWLIVGGGTGWYLLEVLKRTSPREVVYIDASSAMINLTQKRLSAQTYKAKIRLIHSDIRNFHSDNDFDVIVTNFFLDVFKEEELGSVIKKLHSCISGGGIWMLTDFNLQHSSLHKSWQVRKLQKSSNYNCL